MRGRRRAVGAALPLACAAALLGGCSGGSGDEVVVPDGPVASAPAPAISSAAPSAPAEPSEPSEPPASAAAPPADGDLFVVEERPVVAPELPAYELEVRAPDGLPADEADVVAAWRAFWETVVTASGVPAYDDAAVGAVATDQALVDARAYVQGLVDRQQRVTGRLVVVADDISVDEDVAAVSGCGVQQDGEVDASGGVVSLPEGPTGVRTELVREGDRWRVSLWGVEAGLCS